MSRERFEKTLQEYASQHATGSIGLVRKIAGHFYDARQPEIESLKGRLHSYVEAFRREENRADVAEGEIDAKTKVIDDLALEKGILKAEIGRLKDEVDLLRKDAEMLDWLSDPKQSIGNVQLPTHCVQNNLHSLRDAITDAMKETK